MSKHLVSQATAFGFAVMVTLSMLAGVNQLATQEHAATALAKAQAASHQAAAQPVEAKQS